MTGASPWAEGLRPAGVYYAFRVGAFIAEHLPEKFAERLAGAGGRLAYRLAKGKRQIVRRNYARVVGDTADLDDLVKKGFVSYAEYWLETFRLGRYSKSEILDRVVYDEETLRTIEDAFATGRGIVLATGHIGFYDFGVAWVGAMGWPFTTIAEVLRPRALFEWFAAIREARGMGVIPARPGREARAKMSALIRQNKGVAILADRDISRRGVWTEFFGERTTFPAGPASLVVETGAALVIGAIVKEGRGFRVIFRRAEPKMSGDEQADRISVASTIADGLEGLIRAYPEQWHLFTRNWPSDEEGLPPRGREQLH